MKENTQDNTNSRHRFPGCILQPIPQELYRTDSDVTMKLLPRLDIGCKTKVSKFNWWRRIFSGQTNALRFHTSEQPLYHGNKQPPVWVWDVWTEPSHWTARTSHVSPALLHILGHILICYFLSALSSKGIAITISRVETKPQNHLFPPNGQKRISSTCPRKKV